MKYWKGSRRIKAVTKADYDILSDLRDSVPMSKVKAGPPVKKYKVDVRFEELESKLSTMENKIHCFESLDAAKERLVVENNQLAASLKALEDEMRCKKKEMDALQKVVSTVKANLQCLICQALLIEGVILPCCNNYGCCDTCIEHWLSDRQTCPYCRADLLIGRCINMPVTTQLANITSAIHDYMGDIST